MLPVGDAVRSLLPGAGLRRGSVVGISGTVPGTTSLLFALIAQASRTGSWCALVGMPQAGFVAAAETGIALDRLAVVPNPGPDWPNVVAALIDGFDVVVIGVHRIAGQVATSVCAQMAARARRRGSVLVPVGPGWDGAEITLTVTSSDWTGVGEGVGRRIAIAGRGRGAAAVPRRTETWLPEPVFPEPVKWPAPTPLHQPAPAYQPVEIRPTGTEDASPVGAHLRVVR